MAQETNNIPKGFINIKIETFQPDSQQVSRITNRECQSFTIDEFLNIHNHKLFEAFGAMLVSTAKEITDPTPKTDMA